MLTPRTNINIWKLMLTKFTCRLRLRFDAPYLDLMQVKLGFCTIMNADKNTNKLCGRCWTSLFKLLWLWCVGEEKLDMQHTHTHKKLISEITGYGLPFCSCNKQERSNNIPAFLFRTANSVPAFCNRVANCVPAFLAVFVPLVFYCSPVLLDFLLIHRVNTSESAGMNLWITEIKWSAGMNHLIWFSYIEPVELKPSGSHSQSDAKEETRKRGKNEREWENVGNEVKIENAVHLLKRPVTCLNKEIKDNKKLVIEMITSH